MGYIQQAASPVADSYMMSMVTWFRLPSVANGGVALSSLAFVFSSQAQSLLNFGLTNLDSGEISYVRLGSKTERWQFQVQLAGGGIPSPLPPPPVFCSRNNWDSDLMTVIGAETYDAWHVLAWSWDGSQGLSPGPPRFVTLSTNPTWSFVLDGAPLTGTSSPTDSANRSIFEASPNTGLYINGYPMGIPASEEQLFYEYQNTARIDFGPTIIWMNQYIDWSIPSNFANIVTVSGDTGTPAPIDDAITAYGQPDYYFTGGAGAFPSNRGTGGSFTLVGTASNVGPNPSVDLVE